MQLWSCFFNLTLFEECYSCLLDGMLYGSTLHVLALINLKVQFFGCSWKLLKNTFVHRNIFIVAVTSI